MTIQPYKMSF